MMVNAGRTLLEATVTDVGIGPYVYPACGQCYSKLLFVRLQDCQLYRCQNCGRSYSYGQEQFRYRLCLTVTDGTAIASLTTFGGMLNSFFGVPATEFHRLMSSAEAKYGASYASIIQAALEQAFIGQRLLFGLKTSFTTRQKHAQIHNGHSAVSLRDICQSSVTSSQKSASRHLPDLIAVQIMPVTDSSFSATVVDCLQNLKTTIEACSLAPDALADRTVLLQILSLCRSSNRDKSPSLSDSFMRDSSQSCSFGLKRHGCQLPADNTSCNPTPTVDSSFDQSSLAFSCDDSQETIFVPGKPGLTICTSYNPRVAVCLPHLDVSTKDQVNKHRSHLKHRKSVKGHSFCQEDENGNSAIKSCLTPVTCNSKGILSEKDCELIDVCKCELRRADGFLNSKLYSEYNGLQKIASSQSDRSKLKTVDGQCDIDRHKIKNICDQSNVTKCNCNRVTEHTVETACDHNVGGRLYPKTVCDQSNAGGYIVRNICDLGEHNEKTICCHNNVDKREDQSDINKRNAKQFYSQSSLDRRKMKTVCKQRNTDILSHVSNLTYDKHQHVQGYCTKQDTVSLENKENLSQNVDTTTTPCKIRQFRHRPTASTCQLSLQDSPLAVNKNRFCRRRRFKKGLIQKHGFSKSDSLSTDTEELVSTSCPLEVKDCVVKKCALPDSHTEVQLTADSSEQSLQKAHSEHSRLRLFHSDQSTFHVTLDNERLYNLASVADEKYKLQRYSEETCAGKKMSQITELEDIPGKLMEEFASQKTEECLSKTVEGSSSKLIEDYPESEGLDVFLSKIRENSQSNVMECIPSILWGHYSELTKCDGSLSMLKEDNPLKVMVDYPSEIMEDYPSEIMEDYPESDERLSSAGDSPSKLTEDFPPTLLEVYAESEGFGAFLSKLREDGTLELREDSASELREDSASELREETLKLVEDNTSEVRKHSSTDLREDRSLKVREDNSTDFREDNSLKLSEDNSTDLSEDNSADLREDNSLKLRKDYSPESMKKYPESKDPDFSTLSSRGNNPSELMEDYPESEGLDAFLTRLNSSTISHSNYQSQDNTTETIQNHLLTEKLDGNAEVNTVCAKKINSMQPTGLMLKCDAEGCSTRGKGTPAARLPSIVLVETDHLAGTKKHAVSQVVKNLPKKRTFVSQRCRKGSTFSGIKTVPEPGISCDYRNPLTLTKFKDSQSLRNQSASQGIQSSRNQSVSLGIQSLTNKSISQDNKSLRNQGVYQDIQYSRNQGKSHNIKIIEKQVVAKNTKLIMKQDAPWSVKKTAMCINLKTIKEQTLSKTDTNSEKKSLFQATQSYQESAERIKDKLPANVEHSQEHISSLQFANNRESYKVPTINTSLKVANSDLCNNCEQLSSLKSVGSQENQVSFRTARSYDNQTLLETGADKDKEISLQNAKHSADHTFKLQVVSSVKTSNKSDIQEKKIARHSKKRTLDGKVTSRKEFILQKSCQNQVKRTLPQLNEIGKKQTYLRSLEKQPVNFIATMPWKGPSQQTVHKSKKNPLSVNYTSAKQVLQNISTPAKGDLFSEYTTPMKTPQQNVKSSRKVLHSAKSTNVKKQTLVKAKSSATNILPSKCATPQRLAPLCSRSDARKKMVLNYVTPKQNQQLHLKNSKKIVSSNYATPSEIFLQTMKNSRKIVSTNFATPHSQLNRKMLPISEKCMSSFIDVTSKSQISLGKNKNSEYSILSDSSKNTEQQLSENTSAAEYFTPPIDVHAISMNVTLRKAKRTYCSGKLEDKSSTNLFDYERTCASTLSSDQLNYDTCALVERPTGKMSRVSGLDPCRGLGDLSQVTESLLLANSCVYEENSDRSFQTDGCGIPDKNFQKTTSHRIVEKDGKSTQKDSCTFQKYSPKISVRNVEKDSISSSHCNIMKDSTNLSQSGFQTDSIDCQLQPSKSGRKLTVGEVHDTRTTHPVTQPQICQGGHSASDAFPVLVGKSINKSVASKVPSRGCVLENSSAHDDTNHTLGELFSGSGHLVREKDKFTSWQDECSRRGDCNTENITDLSGLTTEDTNMTDLITEITDMKSHVVEALNESDSLAKLAGLVYCSTPIRDINYIVTKFTDVNNQVSKTIDTCHHIREITGGDNSTAEIMDKTDIITDRILQKNNSGCSEVLFDCTNYVCSHSSDRQLDVGSQNISYIQQFDTEVAQLPCENTEHMNYEYISSLPSDLSQRFICDLESMKAPHDLCMSQKRLQIIEADFDAFCSQTNAHLAAEVDHVLSDSLSDLFSSEDDDSVFESGTFHNNEFGRETSRDLIQKTQMPSKPNMNSVRLDQSYSESQVNNSANIHCQRDNCGSMVAETLLLHETNPTSDDCEGNYSKNQLGNISRIEQVTKQVRFSDNNMEQSYFTFEAVSHRPVVKQDMHYLKSCLKRESTEWEPAGSQDLFSEPSQDFAADASMPVEPGSCYPHDVWDSSIELFSQTPEKSDRKILLSTQIMTSANSASVSHSNGNILCGQPVKLLDDQSFDLFTPSPPNRYKIHSDSGFSPELNYPVQVCVTPDLFS